MSKKEIMEATSEAFRKHGYADLSIQKIADELGSGKSLIYYHFDNKEDLMESFLDFLTEEIRKELSRIKEADDQLDAFLSMALGDDKEMWAFRKALFEMRGRAPYNQEFARKFQKLDRVLLNSIKEILEENEKVEEPGKSAELLLSVIDGLIARRITTSGEKDIEPLREKIKQIINKEKR